jgi:hypothetical protein
MQNPLFSLQLSRNNHKITQVIQNLQTLQASSFAIISPSVNFCNTSHAIEFKKQFKTSYKQTHISASYSNMGKQAPHNTQETLTGGAAILSLDHWALPKVHSTQHDPRGHGTFYFRAPRLPRKKLMMTISDCSISSHPKGY